MAKSKAVYKSYLLRLWSDGENGRFRIHLEHVGKEKEVLHFADIESFIDHLLSIPLMVTEIDGKGNKAC